MAHDLKCYRCGASKTDEEFIRRVDDRYYRMCRTCVSDILLMKSKGKQRLPHSKTHRICYLCRRSLPNNRFTRRSNGTYFSACKDCNRHVFGQRRRARMASADGAYSYEEWLIVLSQYPRCPDCDRAWSEIPVPTGRKGCVTVDHTVPISKGGSNYIENVRPLCYSCNSKKGNRTPR